MKVYLKSVGVIGRVPRPPTSPKKGATFTRPSSVDESGKAADVKLIQDGLMLPEYYDARGWDPETGNPTNVKLKELGLARWRRAMVVKSNKGLANNLGRSNHGHVKKDARDVHWRELGQVIERRNG